MMTEKDPVRINSSRRLRAFLCHSSGDKPSVRNLYHRLRANGFDPWLDEEDILPGQDWELEIIRAVNGADIIIVCISRDSITKTGYVQKEIKFALDAADMQPEGTIFLIPLRFEECEIPTRLRKWQWVNYFDDRGYEKLVRALTARANQILEISSLVAQVTATPVQSSTNQLEIDRNKEPIADADGSRDVSGLLRKVRNGDEIVFAQLISLLIPKLSRIATKILFEAGARYNLTEEDLVNEVCLRLLIGKNNDWSDESHFLAAANRQMRHILINYAGMQAKSARKSDLRQVSLEDAEVKSALKIDNKDLAALDDALKSLEATHSRAGRVVELRFFVGLTEAETAEVLGVGLATVRREWAFAKSWLYSRLKS